VKHISEIQIGDKFKHLPSGKIKMFKHENDIAWAVINPDNYIIIEELKYYCDDSRHLICVPYSIENLHKMAEDLEIKRCWFHKNHYDIPKLRIEEIKGKCEIISTKEILKIINSETDNKI